MTSEKCYVGAVPEPMEWFVHIQVGASRQYLNPRFDIANHSPDGFAWGYVGSGPSQLALAILCDALGDERARKLYHAFARQVLASLHKDRGFMISKASVTAWAARQPTA